MAHVERLRIHPVKALDGIDVDAAAFAPGGTLAGDREYALFDADGEVINGKRTARVHELDTAFDPDASVLTVCPPGDGDAPDGAVEGDAPGSGGRDRDADGDAGPRRFHLSEEGGRTRAADWFGAFFGASVTVRRDADLGYVDRRTAGPSVISTATIEAVATWFDDLTPESVRRRLRANVEVGGVPAFWEDRFVGEDAPAFVVRTGSGADGGEEAGDEDRTHGVRFEGVEPCGRCVVPERDPDTGEPTPEFRERFVERREATFPDWADADAFQHLYTLMLIARVPDADRDGVLRVGDEVTVVPSDE